MSLREFGMNPLWVSTHRLSEPLCQSLKAMSAHATCHRSASPEGTDDQTGVFGAESYSSINHEAYDPIVASIRQGCSYVHDVTK